jgi:biopolymer transport protein ExbD
MAGADLGGGGGLRCDINVTPLVDVMLVLLVIFMVVTPMLRLELPIDLPQTKSGTATEQAEQVTLTAGTDGVLLLDGAPVAKDALEATIRERFAQRDDRIIFLEADRNLPYADVVDLMDTCRTAGIERIGVLTRRAVGEPAAAGSQ